MSISKHRSLLLRANRFLGSAMVSEGLLTSDAQEDATHRLLEIIQQDNLKQASLLYILLYELKAFREEALINHLVESSGIGLIDLHGFDLAASTPSGLDTEACWATWTIPFQTLEDVHLLATAYYLSPPVRKFWTEQLSGRILWYGATAASILEGLEVLTGEGKESSTTEDSAN